MGVDRIGRIYENKKDGYLGLEFGYVLGKKAAFLLQNICPVTEEYVVEKYITKDGHDVSIPSKKRKEINKKAVKLIALTKKGKKCTLSNALYVYEELTRKKRTRS